MIQSVSKDASPKIKIALDYSIIGNTQMQSDNAGNNAVMPMVGLSIPVFNSKKYNGKKEQLSLNNQTIHLQKKELQNVLQTEYLKAENQKSDAERAILFDGTADIKSGSSNKNSKRSLYCRE